MARVTRPVIAINETTGERIEFPSIYAAGNALGVSHNHVLISLGTGTSAKGWKVYDTPENLRKKVQEIEGIIEMLEGSHEG